MAVIPRHAARDDGQLLLAQLQARKQGYRHDRAADEHESASLSLPARILTTEGNDMKRWNVTLVALLLVCLAQSASAYTNWYVDSNAGSDAGAGTKASPFKTITHALLVAGGIDSGTIKTERFGPTGG